jgi:hypothetical protein
MVGSAISRLRQLRRQERWRDGADETGLSVKRQNVPHEDRGISLHNLMTKESAAQRRLQLFRAIGLRRAARACRVRHIQKGRRRLISERDLMEWLREREAGMSCPQTHDS